nr:PREDICTED: uncharacterized protein LOC109038736 [Bemisia tabaci]
MDRRTVKEVHQSEIRRRSATVTLPQFLREVPLVPISRSSHFSSVSSFHSGVILISSRISSIIRYVCGSLCARFGNLFGLQNYLSDLVSRSVIVPSDLGFSHVDMFLAFHSVKMPSIPVSE